MFGKRSFINGLITGGLIGTIASLFMRPQKKMESTMMAQKNNAEKNAKKLIKGVRKSVKELVKK